MPIPSFKIVSKALKWVRRYLATDQWPEDYWISLTGKWDLNLWSNGALIGADVYLVEDGQTKTGEHFQVFQMGILINAKETD